MIYDSLILFATINIILNALINNLLLMQYLIFRLATVTRVMLLQLSKRHEAYYFQNDLIICFATPWQTNESSSIVSPG